MDKTNEFLAEKLTRVVAEYITTNYREVGFEAKADLYMIILKALNKGIEI